MEHHHLNVEHHHLNMECHHLNPPRWQSKVPSVTDHHQHIPHSQMQECPMEHHHLNVDHHHLNVERHHLNPPRWQSKVPLATDHLHSPMQVGAIWSDPPSSSSVPSHAAPPTRRMICGGGGRRGGREGGDRSPPHQGSTPAGQDPPGGTREQQNALLRGGEARPKNSLAGRDFSSFGGGRTTAFRWLFIPLGNEKKSQSGNFKNGHESVSTPSRVRTHDPAGGSPGC